MRAEDVTALLDLYRTLPGTPRRPCRADRRLATALVRRHIPSETIETALLLATARRLTSSHTRRQTPIRSLHYFLPVIEELLAHPPAPGYLEYLRRRLGMRLRRRPLAPTVAPPAASQPSLPLEPLPAPVQKTTFLRDR